LIFADSFESGDLAAWSSASLDGGDLNVSAAAAQVGSFGLQAVIDDNLAILVNDEAPARERRYRARFYFDPNSISMASGEQHVILYGYSLGSTTLTVLRIELRFMAPDYLVRAGLLNDSKQWIDTPWVALSDAPHPIEIDWRTASTAGANDGGLTLWVDGGQQADLGGVDNDTLTLDRVRLGAVTGIDANTRGTYFFDAFESRRQTYIGP
jgi:hypothetical protein